jgi:hypothetical protein
MNVRYPYIMEQCGPARYAWHFARHPCAHPRERQVHHRQCVCHPFPLSPPAGPEPSFFRTVDLRAFLCCLRLRPPTQLALPAHTPHRTLTFDAYLLQPSTKDTSTTRISVQQAAHRRSAVVVAVAAQRSMVGWVVARTVM